MQALMLAAGMGKRLGKYTNNNTKCMVEVAGKKLIDRAIEAVQSAGINKMILVVGYKGENVINYIKDNYKNSNMQFIFINNKDYDKSNNIYSFYLAKDYLLQDDTILLESDLIYDPVLIKNVVEDTHDNIAVVSKYQKWMDGTVVKFKASENNNFISDFIGKNEMIKSEIDLYYKTVNIYKFSKDFMTTYYMPFLETYMQAFGKNSYYETIFKIICLFSKNIVHAYDTGLINWYEIDNETDLNIANSIFRNENSCKL